MLDLTLTYKDKINNEEIKNLQSLFYINLLTECNYIDELDVSKSSLDFLKEYKSVLPTFSQFISKLEDRKKYIDNLSVSDDFSDIFFIDYVLMIYYKKRFKEFEINNNDSSLHDYNKNIIIKMLNRLSERYCYSDWKKIKKTIHNLILTNNLTDKIEKFNFDTDINVFKNARVFQLFSLMNNLKEMSESYFFDKSNVYFNNFYESISVQLHNYLLFIKDLSKQENYRKWIIFNFEKEYVYKSLNQYDYLVKKGLIQNHHIVYPNHIMFIQKNSGYLDDYQFFISNEIKKIESHFSNKETFTLFDNNMSIEYNFDDLMSIYIFIVRNNFFNSIQLKNNQIDLESALVESKYFFNKLSSISNLFDEEINLSLKNKTSFIYTLLSSSIDLNIYEGHDLWLLINQKYSENEKLKFAINYLKDHPIGKRIKSFEIMNRFIDYLLKDYFFYSVETQRIKNYLYNIVLRYHDSVFETAFTNSNMFSLATHQIEINILTDIENYLIKNNALIINYVGNLFYDESMKKIKDKRATISSSNKSLIGNQYDKDVGNINLLYFHNL